MEDSTEHVRRLSEELSNETHACAICTELIRRINRLWSCAFCYGVFHLGCIVLWAQSRQKEREKHLQSTSTIVDAKMMNKFSCPLCQGVANIDNTAQYQCYCGKVINPPVDMMLVPGSCGQPCSKRRDDTNCPHRCVLPCHPGPCPPCRQTRIQTCYCGKASKTVGCSSGVNGFECGQPCGKLLDCGHHTCQVPCHEGACSICTVMLKNTCYCGATTRMQRCFQEQGFSCNKPCSKLRDCGRHRCGRCCHADSCEVCLRVPQRQLYCPCGKTRVKVQRTTCLDPVPSCGLLCEIPLLCGHLCWYTCHDNTSCAPCKIMLKEPCACGSKLFTFPCFCTYLPQQQWADAATTAGVSPEQLPICYPLKCAKVCGKLLSCKKHKCSETCCTRAEHLCLRVCTKKLSCGHHECGQLCHQGLCPLCPQMSYERLYCRCRRTWIEPPVPCGTLPPRCNYLCSIPRLCGHPTNHPCHTELECPECVVPVEKLCASHHNLMPYHMACHLKEVSCGRPCNKALPCCNKLCTKTCHGGPCVHTCANKFPSFTEIAKRVPEKRTQ